MRVLQVVAMAALLSSCAWTTADQDREQRLAQFHQFWSCAGVKDCQ